MANRPPEAALARILVVEDDRNNQIVITRLLGLAGVPGDHVITVEGDPAGAIASPGPGIDLVFLDLQLPGKDGFAILGELKALPSTRGIPVVALTANVMRQDVDRCRSAGFDGLIGKPIDGRRFGETFARILAGEPVWTVS